MSKMSSEEVNNLINKLKDVNEGREKERLLAIQTLDYTRASRLEMEMISEVQKVRNTLEKENIKLTEEQKKILSKVHGNEDKITKELEKQNRKARTRNTLIEVFNKQLSIGWKYLIDSDKIIRQTSLNLGLSGVKADQMRKSFQESARDVAYLGGSLEDISKIMGGYADETGKSRVLTSSMVKDIEEIARGTGLSVEEATQLGARFEYMGLDARRTNEYVQGVVDTTERMGVNTTKVLKNINNNFKRLTTFSFKNGTKAFKEMAESSESTRVSMETTLSIAEATRSLESVIELGANLQVMGGEFAKMDPLAWLHMSRNEPEKISDHLSKMTAGIYTIRKNSEGVFEKFISPADRDRLASVAKSLGVSNDEMFEIAQRQAEMSLMSKQLAGTGLTEREKELIKGAAHFNSKSGKFQVQLGGTMKDISTLTKDQARAFKLEQTLLEDRAIAAQDFDTALKATIEEFKSVLLPMLKGINSLFEKVRSFSSSITKLVGGGKDSNFMKGLGTFAVSIVLLNKTVSIFNKSITGFLSGLVNKKASSWGGLGGVGSSREFNKTIAGGGSKALGAGKGAMYAAKGSGLKALGTGAGVGAAGLGIGAGIGLAAGGISLLADSMSKLNNDQAETLRSIVKSVSIISTVGAVAAASIAAFGKSANIASPGLAKIALPILGIGAGIGIATAGIGFMAVGLSKMMDSSAEASGSLTELAGGIGLLSLAMLGLGSGFLGMLTLTSLLKTISKHAPSVKMVGDGFREINTLMSGSKDNFENIESIIKSISSMSDGSNNPFKDLVDLIKNGIPVRFDNKEVVIQNRVSLSIDKKDFTSDVIHVPTLMEMIEKHRVGK